MSYSQSYDAFPVIISFVVSMIFSLAIYAVVAFLMMKLFQKANVVAWKAWVPVVNSWKFLELGGYPGWYCLFAFAAIIPVIGMVGPFAALVFMVLAAYQIGLKLDKEAAWVVLYIFVAPVWIGILGLNATPWDDSRGKPALGTERPPTSGFGSAPPPPGGFGTTTPQQPYPSQQPQQPVPPQQQYPPQQPPQQPLPPQQQFPPQQPPTDY